ncbi:hypothetical protein WJX72_001646 [[Myrmecia] bisecta]|uniref:Uncharacterized protein n=1 Tax=[Myrmecia] bisecta TaxID=41462 RepID=A0AAW1PJ72_9CHLO
MRPGPHAATLPSASHHRTCWERLSQSVQRPLRLTVEAKGARRKPNHNKPRTNRAAWKFERLMLAWDDAVEATCQNSEQAAQLHRLASEGYAAHGRGCVLVQTVLESPEGQGQAHARALGISRHLAELALPSSAGNALSTNAELCQRDWKAVYVSGLEHEGKDVGGEVSYNPDNELVLLFAAQIDGHPPTIGADTVQVTFREDGQIVLTMPGLVSGTLPP